MRHLRGDVDEASCENVVAFCILYHIALDVFWESCHQKFQFLIGVNRSSMIFVLEISIENVPELPDIIHVCFMDRQVAAVGLMNSSSSLFGKTQFMHQGNGGGDFSCRQPSLTCLHDGIEIFLRWNMVVNPRYCFVYDFLESSFFQVDIDSLKNLTGDGCRHFVAGKQSAVCESLM